MEQDIESGEKFQVCVTLRGTVEMMSRYEFDDVIKKNRDIIGAIDDLYFTKEELRLFRNCVPQIMDFFARKFLMPNDCECESFLDQLIAPCGSYLK